MFSSKNSELVGRHCVYGLNFQTCLAEISSERTLDDERILIAVSSSRIFPFVKKKQAQIKTNK